MILTHTLWYWSSTLIHQLNYQANWAAGRLWFLNTYTGKRWACTVVAWENSQHFAVTTWALAKRHLSNVHSNSILMTCHYSDLGSASDWLQENSLAAQPIRSTTKIWVVTHEFLHSLLGHHFERAQISGDLVKCQLFFQAMHEHSSCYL